jgi:hypothetical protein
MGDEKWEAPPPSSPLPASVPQIAVEPYLHHPLPQTHE